MTRSLFVQLHSLVSYPAALLNRDDVGYAKRIPFGGAVRTRVSSQCLKRHWRSFEGEHALRTLTVDGKPLDMAVRSRQSFDRFVLAPLLGEKIDPALARAATEAVMVAVLGESAKAKKAKEDGAAEENGKGAKKKAKKGDEEAVEAPPMHTGQVTVLGKAELDYFLAEARALAKAAGSSEAVKDAAKERFSRDWLKNLAGLKRAAGLDAALFGRMVTSDKLARCDAAIHVAHAFTVHAEQAEPDYFSAVDDLLGDGDTSDLGSGHIGTTELTSGLFYGYVVVDVAQLVSNLEGVPTANWTKADRKLAGEVVASLVHTMARVSPGAKLGSTAPYAYAHMVMAEIGASQPRTLANAFLKPVPTHPDPVDNAYRALAKYVRDVDCMYGLENKRVLAAVGAPDDLVKVASAPGSLAEVANAARNAIVEQA